MALATGVVVGGALLFTQALEPGWARFRELREARSIHEEALESDQALADRLSSIKERKATLWATLAPPPDTSLVPWVMEHVREQASAAGFKPSSLRFVAVRPYGKPQRGRRSAKTQPAFLEVRIEVRARVRFKEAQDFLCRLAASDRHVRVQSLDLTPRKGGDRVDLHVQLLALAPREAYRGLEGAELR
jgi:hypothetical protein